MKVISVNIENPYIIRYLEKAYVDAFMDNGEIVLSSFSHLHSSVDSHRRDASEGVISQIFPNYKVIGDVSNRFLVLCASLSFNERARCHKDAGVLITDINQFCGYIQCALEDIGIHVKAIYHDPCNYCGRDLTFKQTNINSRENLIKQIQSALCIEDLLFSKEPDFDFECEYRLVFELTDCLSDDKNQVKLYLDKTVKSFCRKILF